MLTPSYAAHVVEWAAGRASIRGSSVERVLVAGEPEAGSRPFRARLEEGWGAKVTEAMGVGDIGVSLWGECEEQDGMHLGARGFVHAELIDPETAVAVELRDGAAGELVLTHLRHRAAPLRASGRAITSRCAGTPCPRPHEPAGAMRRADRRHADRPRGERLSLGRSRVVSAFAPGVSGHILLKPPAPGVKQEPPPVAVELRARA